MTDPTIRRITHPTDFSQGSETAFHHALRLAAAAGAQIDILHVDPDPQVVTWDQFPQVRDTLELWQRAGAVTFDGEVPVEKITDYGKEPVGPILEHLDEYPSDLMVLATHRREGIDRWLHREVAQKVARSRLVNTLFIPHGVEGFVSPSTGVAVLRRVLIPIDWQPPPQAAVDAAVDFVRLLAGDDPVEITLLHVGDDEEDMPAVQLPAREGWRWQQRTVPGEVVEAILRTSEDEDADLVVMATQGHDGFLDALRGSNTERVLRQSKCPVLSVPSVGF